MSDSSEWVSLGEAADIIGVHPATIRNWAERGELPFRRTPGGHRRFRRSDLKQWLASHRLTLPTEAQVIVQSALGRARLEIADRQQLNQQDWYEQLSPNTRETMRRQGLRLMDSLITYLANPGSDLEMATAQEIGEIYGRILRDEGLPLTRALQGYFYFVDFLMEAVIQMSEANMTRSVTDWGDMMRQVTQFTRATLIGMIDLYAQPTLE